MPPEPRRRAGNIAWRRPKAGPGAFPSASRRPRPGKAVLGAPTSRELHLDVVREEPLGFDDAWVARVVTAALAAAGHRPPASLTVLFAGDDHLRALNRTFRGLDKATDVLSFEAGGPATGAAYLGDVAISVPRALEQGERHGHGAAREVGYLLVHGVLHLLGHDHEADADQAAMRAVEEAALARVGLARLDDQASGPATPEVANPGDEASAP